MNEVVTTSHFIIGVIAIVIECSIIFLLGIVMHCCMYRKGFNYRDSYRIFIRFFRRIFMSNHTECEKAIKEFQKIKNAVKLADLPLKEKEYLIWKVESQEEEVVKKFYQKMHEETLKKLREEV